MNIMNRLAWRSMWKNKTRTVVTIIGILLSAAMFTAVVTLGVSLLQYLIGITVYIDGDYFIRFDYVTEQQLEGIEAREEISQLGIAKTVGYAKLGTEEANQSYCVTALDENTLEIKTIYLLEGRLPRIADEIAVPEHALYYLSTSGNGSELGDILTIDVVPEYVDEHYFEHMVEFPAASVPAFTRSYVIVGILENESSRLTEWSMEPMNLLTMDDGSYPGFQWSRCYAKTTDPMDAYALQDLALSTVCSVNTNLLNYYGASKYTNINEMIYTVCAVLMAIILVGSVSLIYNAFSISLSERSRDFGLLSSIGATKRQLRRSVYFEALCLSAIAVPIGILCGYFGIDVTLWLTGDLISGLLAGGIESGITFVAVPSLPAFFCAGIVAVLTVLISAWLPLRRAMKLDPIRSIRQAGDYQVPKRHIRGGGIAAKLFGVPGLMSAKYYRISRKKYSSTVISLTISVVLFLSSFSFVWILRQVADVNTNTYNCDLEVYSPSEEDAELIRAREDVERSALISQYQYHGIVDLTQYAQRFAELVARQSGEPDAVPAVNVYFLEDEVFRATLQEQGIDPEPYFDEANPAVIVCPGRVTVYERNGEDLERQVYEAQVFDDAGGEILLFSAHHPGELQELIEEISGGWDWTFSQWQGYPVQTFTFTENRVPEKYPFNADGTLSVVRIPRTAPDGSYVTDYHFLRLDTGELVEEPIFTEVDTYPFPTVRAIDQLDELPFGIHDYSGTILTVVMPMSLKFGPASLNSLAIKTSDYSSLTDWLDANYDGDYGDYLAQQIQYRNLITMINVFTYGFIILISLICVCNVFNTISTNIALRRRDFGMLRSVGMQTKDLSRMMVLECARYGVKSLLFGLPIGVAIGYGIYVLLDIGSAVRYRLPWDAVLISALCVFTVVFITMFYAVARLRKDNPIDAIRMENL